MPYLNENISGSPKRAMAPYVLKGFPGMAIIEGVPSAQPHKPKFEKLQKTPSIVKSIDCLSLPIFNWERKLSELEYSRESTLSRPIGPLPKLHWVFSLFGISFERISPNLCVPMTLTLNPFLWPLLCQWLSQSLKSSVARLEEVNIEWSLASGVPWLWLTTEAFKSSQSGLQQDSTTILMGYSKG